METEIKQFVKVFKDWLDNPPVESHDEYLVNLTAYKNIIDRTPNKFLLFHLKDSLEKGRTELANYIKLTMKRRYHEQQKKKET